MASPTDGGPAGRAAWVPDKHTAIKLRPFQTRAIRCGIPRSIFAIIQNPVSNTTSCHRAGAGLGWGAGSGSKTSAKEGEMFELQEGHRIMERAIRQFCEKEIAPHVEKMESGELLPYDLMRKMADAFGIRKMGKELLEKALAKAEEGGEGKEGKAKTRFGVPVSEEALDPMIMAVVGKELCRVSPSFALAFAATI